MAKQYIHQTWAYEIDSDHGNFSFYNNSQEEMYQALTTCYQTIASELSINIIPFGKVIQFLRQLSCFYYQGGGKSLCRDGFHMNEVYGRYALAATWYAYILKGDLLTNSYFPPSINGDTVTAEELHLIKKCIIENI